MHRYEWSSDTVKDHERFSLANVYIRKEMVEYSNLKDPVPTYSKFAETDLQLGKCDGEDITIVWMKNAKFWHKAGHIGVFTLISTFISFNIQWLTYISGGKNCSSCMNAHKFLCIFESVAKPNTGGVSLDEGCALPRIYDCFFNSKTLSTRQR